MNLNVCIIGGNLTKDIETRRTPGGTAVADFTVAVNRKWKDKTGEMKGEVSFVLCSAFGKTAENIEKYFKKGDPIIVDGRIKVDSWTDKEGKKRITTKIIVDTFQFVGGRKQEQTSTTQEEPFLTESDDAEGFSEMS